MSGNGAPASGALDDHSRLVFNERVVRVIAGLTGALLAVVAAGSAAQASSPWHALRRPLHLPSITAGAACPVSAVDTRVDWDPINIFGRSGTGRGPVYPGLGSSAGQLATQPARTPGGWFGGKLFWYAKPSYRGRVLIRGRRLDAPGTLRFGDGAHPALELHIGLGDSVMWSGQPAGARGVPTIARIHAAGCYGVQIDGTSFSRVVVVSVSAPPPAR
jgi:hypothetical protein